jgi:hypothetical protein
MAHRDEHARRLRCCGRCRTVAQGVGAEHDWTDCLRRSQLPDEVAIHSIGGHTEVGREGCAGFRAKGGAEERGVDEFLRKEKVEGVDRE